MTASPREITGNEVVGARTVRRIEWLTCVIGFAAALSAGVVARHWEWSTGLAIGTGLAWLNFRLLQRGVESFLLSAGNQQQGESARRPIPAYLGAVLRYGLIGLTTYAIFKSLHVPLASLVAGLCALGAATMSASVWALVSREE
jgi:small-conductance mechanosensitive channel